MQTQQTKTPQLTEQHLQTLTHRLQMLVHLTLTRLTQTKQIQAQRIQIRIRLTIL